MGWYVADSRSFNKLDSNGRTRGLCCSMVRGYLLPMDL